MRLLLREPVDALGEPGDEVNVRAGYARNYLLPRRIAVPITEENRREVAAAREQWAVRKVEDLKAARTLAETMEGRTLHFERRVKTDSDELYGSVSVQDISRELEAAGFEIARNRIILGGAIKKTGSSLVTIRLHPEIEVRLPVDVAPATATSLGMDPAPTPPAPRGPGGSAPPEESEPDGAPPADAPDSGD